VTISGGAKTKPRLMTRANAAVLGVRPPIVRYNAMSSLHSERGKRTFGLVQSRKSTGRADGRGIDDDLVVRIAAGDVRPQIGRAHV